jgi:cytochrome P450
MRLRRSLPVQTEFLVRLLHKPQVRKTKGSVKHNQFHGDHMRAYSQLICDITKQVTSQWTIGESFLIRSSMQEITPAGLRMIALSQRQNALVRL